ncbi:UBN2_2 domain-containing protein [Fagus crenata]
MLKPPVPSYLDLIPLLHSHELRNKSLLIDQPNPALAFVGQRFNSNKGSSFNSRGKGFHQSGSRPPYNPRTGHHHPSSKNNSQSVTELVPNTLAEWISPSPAPPPTNSPIISPTLDKNHARLFTSENPPSLPPIPSLTPENSALVSSPPHISSPPSLLPEPPTSTHPMTTRGRIGIVKPNPKYALTAVFPSAPPEPKSVKVALRDPG